MGDKKKRGFALLDPDKLKAVSKKGGQSSVGKTGFALMDKEKQREASRRGARKRWDKQRATEEGQAHD
jgi:general stress protein YciG